MYLNNMHELSITQNVLSLALEEAKANKASKITKINLTIGKLSGIVDECVKFYFELLSKDTIAAEAQLSFQQPEAMMRCRKCNITFSPEELNWVCPNCGEQQVEIVSGRECFISSIEVD